jgi:hypothetical protein
MPVRQAIDFAEVQIVEHKTPKKTSAESSVAGLEVVLLSGITLRLAPGATRTLSVEAPKHLREIKRLPPYTSGALPEYL